MASGPSTSTGSWLAEACKAVLAFRALALLLTVLWLPAADGAAPLIGALALAAGATYVPLRRWDRVSPSLLRHPTYLAAETLLVGVILLLAGTESPFFLFTLGTAALAGLIYGYPGATFFAALLIGAYLGAFALRQPFDAIPETYENLLGQPVLYPVAALSAAAVRKLFERQLLAASLAGVRERESAAERERARLARDMHDSLGKTVHGIALEAAALARRLRRDPEAAAQSARTLAADAETAAREARGLVHELREEDGGTLVERVRRRAEAWRQEHGVVSVEVRAEEVTLPRSAQHELLQILSEALRNVERHARAENVEVELVSRDGRVRLAVRDDGAGFVEAAASDLMDGMHFGLVGMRERAALVGGSLDVVSRPGRGTEIAAVVPFGAAAEQEAAP